MTWYLLISVASMAAATVILHFWREAQKPPLSDKERADMEDFQAW